MVTGTAVERGAVRCEWSSDGFGAEPRVTPARAASPESLPRIGNMSFAYRHVGAPERVLEFYEDEVRGN